MTVPTLGLRVARVLHGRWRRLSRADRELLEPLAEDVKERALDLRELREDFVRELERLASADIRATRAAGAARRS